MRSISSNGSGTVEATTFFTSRAAAIREEGAKESMQAPRLAPTTIIAALNCTNEPSAPPSIHCPPSTQAGPSNSPTMLAKSSCVFVPTRLFALLDRTQANLDESPFVQG